MRFRFSTWLTALTFISINISGCNLNDGKDRLMSFKGRNTPSLAKICQIPTLKHRPDEQYYQVLLSYISSSCFSGVGTRDELYYISGGNGRFRNALNLKIETLYRFNLKDSTIYAIDVKTGKETLLSKARRKAINGWFIKNVINEPIKKPS